MLTRITLTLLAVAVLVAAAGFLAAPQAAATSTSWWEQLNETRWDSCNGEYIHITGSVHHSDSVNFDGNGGYHLSLNSNSSQLVAVGQSSGNTYNANINQQTAYYARAPFPVLLRVSGSARFVPTGSGNPIQCTRLYRYQVNGNGTLVRDYISPYTCRCP